MKDKKPAKPFADFPLFAHNTGRWAKKIKGKVRYFGSWDDPDGALANYRAFESGLGQQNSTAKASGDNAAAEKPYPEFPLTPHRSSGRWCKKIRGKLHYFGSLDNPQAALDKYLLQKDDLHAGRKPAQATGQRLDFVLDHYRNAKLHLSETGEISKRHYNECVEACDLVAKTFGLSRAVQSLRPDDFDQLRKRIAKGYGPHTIANAIQKVRSIFKYAYDADLIDRPIKFGPTFKKPTKKVMRRHRAEKGERMFTPDEIKRILDAADSQLKAMILLGLNAGFGNRDCATLKKSAVNLQTGWMTHPRPKTGIDRRCPLWPETVTALKRAIAARPKPHDEADSEFIFITKYGQRWFKDIAACPISAEFCKLLKKLGLKKDGLSFYTLRHVFETIAGKARDQVAIDRIMGHVSEHISATYRERIEDEDERLKRVTDAVRQWALNKTESSQAAVSGDASAAPSEAA